MMPFPTFQSKSPLISAKSKNDWETPSSSLGGDPVSDHAQHDEFKDPDESFEFQPGSPISRQGTFFSVNGDENRARDFGNPSDGDEIGKLMGSDGEKLLSIVDDIRKIDALRQVPLDIPQLVVVGDTSCGKSSLLQALTRLPYPVDKDLCTRFVTETTIRRCEPASKPSYTIEAKLDDESAYGIPPFPKMQYEGQDWPEVCIKLQEDIAKAYRLIVLPPKVPPITSHRVSNTVETPSQLLKHKLIIDVRKPGQAHFSVVDIPGLVREGAPNDIQLSEDLAKKYMENSRAIILAVIQATSALQNQGVLTLARDKKAIPRTIGVITKCDRVENADIDSTLDILRNLPDSPHHLSLGWYAVRNRNSEEVQEQTTFEDRDNKEVELFSGGRWKQATKFGARSKTAINPSVLGIHNLQKALSKSIRKQVLATFEPLKAEINGLKDSTETALRSMGDPRNNPATQRAFLSQIQEIYEEEALRCRAGGYRSEYQGTDHVSKLGHRVEMFSVDFARDTEATGTKYEWGIPEEYVGYVVTKADPNQEPLAGIHDWIRKVWDESTGLEPHLTAPPNLHNSLFEEQTGSWGPKASRYLDRVERAIYECNDHVFKVACKDDEILRAKIRHKLAEKEKQCFQDARKDLSRLIADNRIPRTYDPIFLQTYSHLQKMRLQAQADFVKDHRRKTAPKGSPDNDDDDAVVVPTFSRFFEENKKVYEIHDWLYAHWRIMRPKFVDNVVLQVVWRHLMGPEGPMNLFSRRWMDYLRPEDLEELVGEDETTRTERRNLNELLEGLYEASRKADEAQRS